MTENNPILKNGREVDNFNNQGTTLEIVQRAYGNKNRRGFIARKRKGAGSFGFRGLHRSLDFFPLFLALQLRALSHALSSSRGIK